MFADSFDSECFYKLATVQSTNDFKWQAGKQVFNPVAPS